MKVHILEMPGTILLKFGMLGDDIGQHFHHKNHLVSIKCHGATYTVYMKIELLFFLLITHECGVLAFRAV